MSQNLPSVYGSEIDKDADSGGELLLNLELHQGVQLRAVSMHWKEEIHEATCARKTAVLVIAHEARCTPIEKASVLCMLMLLRIIPMNTVAMIR